MAQSLLYRRPVPTGWLIKNATILIDRGMPRDYHAPPGSVTAGCRLPDNRISLRCGPVEESQPFSLTSISRDFEQYQRPTTRFRQHRPAKSSQTIPHAHRDEHVPQAPRETLTRGEPVCVLELQAPSRLRIERTRAGPFEPSQPVSVLSGVCPARPTVLSAKGEMRRWAEAPEFDIPHSPGALRQRGQPRCDGWIRPYGFDGRTGSSTSDTGTVSSSITFVTPTVSAVRVTALVLAVLFGTAPRSVTTPSSTLKVNVLECSALSQWSRP